MGVPFEGHSNLQVEGQRTEVIWGHTPTSHIFKIFTFKFLMQSLKQK